MPKSLKLRKKLQRNNIRQNASEFLIIFAKWNRSCIYVRRQKLDCCETNLLYSPASVFALKAAIRFVNYLADAAVALLGVVGVALLVRCANDDARRVVVVWRYFRLFRHTWFVQCWRHHVRQEF